MAEKRKAYWELLKDPRWQRKRLEVLEREDFTCQRCGGRENTLHVHHTYYEKGKAPWEYPDHCYMVLCEDCHSYATEERAELEEEIGAFMAWGCDVGQLIGYIRALVLEMQVDQEPKASLVEITCAGDFLGMADYFGMRAYPDLEAACEWHPESKTYTADFHALKTLDARRVRNA